MVFAKEATDDTEQATLEEHRRFENKRYGELFEEARRRLAEHGGPALEVDEGDCVSSGLLVAKQFTDWYRNERHRFYMNADIKEPTWWTNPPDSRLVNRRFNAWFDACMNKFPSIEKMYLAEENALQREQLEAKGVEFITAGAATEEKRNPTMGIFLF